MAEWHLHARRFAHQVNAIRDFRPYRGIIRPAMALRRNILLFHQGALGDFMLTWPIALALGRIHPQSRLFYVTHAQKGKLAEKALGVESPDAEAGWHTLFGTGEPLPDVPGRLLAGAHSVISFLSAPDGPVGRQRAAARAGGERADDQPKPAGGVHRPRDGVSARATRPWPAAHAAAEQIHRSIQSRGVSLTRRRRSRDVVIHPGSGSPQRTGRSNITWN